MIPAGARVWIAMGHTDMRRGMQSLAAMVQQHFTKDPFGGDLWVFRGRSGSLVKIIWHDGIGMSLYAKRLEKGRFVCNRCAGPTGACAVVGWGVSGFRRSGSLQVRRGAFP